MQFDKKNFTEFQIKELTKLKGMLGKFVSSKHMDSSHKFSQLLENIDANKSQLSSKEKDLQKDNSIFVF